MTIPRSPALAAVFSAVLLSTSSLALASEQAPPAAPPTSSEATPGTADQAPAPGTDQPAHHRCRMGAAAKNVRAFFMKPDETGTPRLVRMGITTGVTAVAVAGTAAVAGAITVATALPACAANSDACRAVLTNGLARAPSVQAGNPAAIRNTLSVK